MAALFALSPNTFVTQDCAMRRPASSRSLNAWPGGFFGNSPDMVARSRTLISTALSLGSAQTRARRCGCNQRRRRCFKRFVRTRYQPLLASGCGRGKVIDRFASWELLASVLQAASPDFLSEPWKPTLASFASRIHFLDGTSLGPPRASSGSLPSTPFRAFEAAPRGHYRVTTPSDWRCCAKNPHRKSEFHSYAPPCRPRTATSFSKKLPANTGFTGACSTAVFSRAWMIGG